MIDNSPAAIALRGAVSESLRAARLCHEAAETEGHSPLYRCTCKGAVLYQKLIAEHGDECSICRRVHGLEYIHECE